MAFNTVQISQTVLEPARLRRVGSDQLEIANSSATQFELFVRELAVKLTASSAEAEAAANEMFIDIRLFALRGKNDWADESVMASRLAQRRLIRYLR